MRELRMVTEAPRLAVTNVPSDIEKSAARWAEREREREREKKKR
jgi:hypothetical protein